VGLTWAKIALGIGVLGNVVCGSEDGWVGVKGGMVIDQAIT